jgi:hypothetical protein
MELVHTQQDVVRLNGQHAEVAGRYRALEQPIRGTVKKPRPKDHAVLELDDGAVVYLEPFDSPAARRPVDEPARFDGKRVRVTGIVYKVMPARGESPMAPCVAEITQIRQEDPSEAKGG